MKKGVLPSTDLEPEYIAVSDSKAYITLQEANAIAKLDLNSLEIEDIYSVGFEDYSKIAIDIDKKDEKYNAQTYDSLKGIRMPDAISVYTVDGIDYLITANEGDSRDWNGYSNEIEVNFGKGKTSPTGKITADNSGLTGKVTFFDTSDYDGLNNENDYLFGGRSSTIFKADEQSLQEIYTTGNDFEVKTAAYLPNNFNCSNDDATIDDRSGKKGPEAEAVTIGQIEDKTFAFIGLERIGGIMVYDITNPEKTEFVNYINSRDFSTDIGGDDSLEGIHFIAGNDSITGKPQLVVAYEVSGTVGVYDLTLQKNSDQSGDDKTDNPSQEPTVEETNNSSNTNTNNKNHSVNTGDASNIAITIISLISTIVLITILMKKDKVLAED